jgi:hypothetical protein
MDPARAPDPGAALPALGGPHAPDLGCSSGAMLRSSADGDLAALVAPRSRKQETGEDAMHARLARTRDGTALR